MVFVCFDPKLLQEIKTTRTNTPAQHGLNETRRLQSTQNIESNGVEVRHPLRDSPFKAKAKAEAKAAWVVDVLGIVQENSGLKKCKGGWCDKIWSSVELVRGEKVGSNRLCSFQSVSGEEERAHLRLLGISWV